MDIMVASEGRLKSPAIDLTTETHQNRPSDVIIDAQILFLHKY
jgi:hypothetical protein